MFINDIDGAVDIMNSIMSKFVDDTKRAKIVENEGDLKIFQDGLKSLMKWSQDVEKWSISPVELKTISPVEIEY